MRTIIQSAILGVAFIGNLGFGFDRDRLSDPLCFLDLDQDITLTIDVWGGEGAGQIAAKLISDEENLSVISVGASKNHPGAHEVLLSHKRNNIGWIGVELSNPKSATTKYYALEFRSKLSSCSRGANFEVELH